MDFIRRNTIIKDPYPGECNEYIDLLDQWKLDQKNIGHF